MFITPAHAQSLGSIVGFDVMSLMPLVLIFAVFYFLLIRPQQKKGQQQRDMLAALRRGDRIVTNGGIIGLITKVVSDQELEVEIAQNVRVRVARSMVADLLSKTQPVSEKDDKEEEKNSIPHKKPVAKQPVAKQPVAKKPAIKKPVRKKTGK